MGEKEKEEERMRKRRRRRRKKGKRKKRRKWKSDTKTVPPSPDAFPSTKLGNNITPIEGRLEKNTSPTCRRSIGTKTEYPGGSHVKTTKP